MSVQERKLYITRIQNTDAGEYTCMGFLEGNSQERKVSLQIFSKFIFHLDIFRGIQHRKIFIIMQSQKAVSAYLKSKHALAFWLCTAVC